MKAEEYVRYFDMQRHPEGGFYKETYRSSRKISSGCLPENINGDRSYSTAIYFLLQRGDFSAFHRIKSDECWHFYEGGSLLIHVLETNGQYRLVRLGKNIGQGEVFQFVVPAGAWFASEPARETDFSLVGCTVAPGFDFADFEMADKIHLLQQYPNHADVIHHLCK